MRTLIACVAVSLLAAEDGKLHRAGEQARQPRPAPAPGRPSAPAPNPGHAPATDDCATDLGDQLAGQTVGLLFEGSYLLTYGMFGSGDEHWRGSYALTRHPYDDGGGWLAWKPSATAPAGDAAPAHVARTRSVAGVVGVDLARIEDDLARAGIDGRVFLPFRLEVEARGDWYRERLDDGAADAVLAGGDLTWRALQFANCGMRLGGGGRWWHDEDGDLGGAVFATGFDLYPIRPLAIAGGYAIGRLGTATLRQGRIEAGGFVGAAEIAIGWERTSIGAVSFGGPYAALRWWF